MQQESNRRNTQNKKNTLYSTSPFSERSDRVKQMLLFGGNTAAASSGETSGQYCDKSRTNMWSITQRQANGKKTQ